MQSSTKGAAADHAHRLAIEYFGQQLICVRPLSGPKQAARDLHAEEVATAAIGTELS
jgi:hypothetical protein